MGPKNCHPSRFTWHTKVSSVSSDKGVECAVGYMSTSGLQGTSAISSLLRFRRALQPKIVSHYNADRRRNAGHVGAQVRMPSGVHSGVQPWLDVRDRKARRRHHRAEELLPVGFDSPGRCAVPVLCLVRSWPLQVYAEIQECVCDSIDHVASIVSSVSRKCRSFCSSARVLEQLRPRWALTDTPIGMSATALDTRAVAARAAR